MTKRKPRKPKTTTPRQKRNYKKDNSKIKIINLVLFILIITLVTSILSYFFLLKNNEAKNTPTQTKKAEIKKDIDLNNYANEKLNKYFMDESNKLKFEEYTDEFDKEYHPKQEEKKEEETKIEKKEEIKKDIPIISKKPKLAIVIDDVTTRRQVKDILNVGYKITMSFLPPTRQHKDSAIIAQNLPFYMIHLPLQAQTFKFAEEKTLKVGDSYEKIEKRVIQLKKWYPNAIYTNNHTGSKFTEDDVSMDYLFKALKKHNLIFVDSRTTAKTVAKKYAKKYDMPYIARNIFIDNQKDFSYIQNQLKKAINIAKKNGYSMAIGHPYDITIQVLRESKHLLKDLELIYVNELPNLKKD